jgi:unsaturated rhamnogalacturonyl hydrolase
VGKKTTGTSPIFWSRSLGWYAALVDVLDYFPRPSQAKLLSYLNQLAESLSEVSG